MEMETITLNTEDLFKEISRKVSTLIKKENVKVKVSYYWDSHGKLVSWDVDGKHTQTFNGNAEIKKTELVREWTYGGRQNEEYWDLFVNDKKIDNGDVQSYSYNPNTNTMSIKMICGWG